MFGLLGPLVVCTFRVSRSSFNNFYIDSLRPTPAHRGAKKNKRIWDLREKRHKGVEKGDKAFLESLYYTKERVTMQLPMEERKVGDAGWTDGQMHGQRQLYTVGGA